ncbi:hypothetical protein [Microbacterium sp.]|uniref:hypothetical protein n=1 Tax=Microbacterium sp. TaxID=51671 RepID=UPI00356ABDD2
MNDNSKDEPVPWELIAPLVSWMVRHNVPRIRVAATTVPTPAVEEPARDESVHLLYCDDQPMSPALLDVYITADEDGQGRINGPTDVPQDVLRPLVRALDDASVSELLVATAPEPAGPEAAASSTTLTAERSDDIEEHEVPLSENWPPPVFAVQAPRGDGDV